MTNDLAPQIALGFAALKGLVETSYQNNFTRFSKEIGVSPQAVSEVMRKGTRCPVSWCLKVESLTQGRIPRSLLRPDVYPVGQVVAA